MSFFTDAYLILFENISGGDDGLSFEVACCSALFLCYFLMAKCCLVVAFSFAWFYGLHSCASYFLRGKSLPLQQYTTDLTTFVLFSFICTAQTQLTESESQNGLG